MVYGKLANDDNLKALFATCNDLDDEVLIGAVGRHVDNAEQSGSSLAGEWCPKPAQVRFHANALQVEKERLRRQELELKAAKLRENEERPTTTVAFPDGAALGLPTEIAVNPNKCPTCRDSGFSYYYCPSDRSRPAYKYRVYLADEYTDLPGEIQRTLDRFPAVCDCAEGRLRRERAPHAHTTGINCHGRSRRVYITIEEARTMSAKRRAKDKKQITIGAVK
jgi:hypothetical protein